MIKEKAGTLKGAVLLNAIAKYANILINLAFTVVLARLLSPDDYGVVAIVTVFTTFFAVFSDMGLSTAVIQNKELTQDDNNHIYSFSVFLAILLAIVFCVFSYPMSLFYEDEVYIGIGCLLSIALLFDTVNMIPNALIMKDKKFVIMSIRIIVVCIIKGIFTVIFALLGYKYYAIIYSTIIASIITFFWNRMSVKLHFQLKIQWASVKKVFAFSMFQFAFNLVNYFARNLDNLLTGKFMGKAELGYYNKAYSLMQYPTANLTNVITPVLHPILSDYQNDKEYIYKQYMKIVRLLALVGIFVSAYCYIAADEIVLILFGSKWNSTIPCFRLLSLSVWAQIINASAGAIFQSIGKVKDLFVCGLINAILNIVMILLGVATKDIVYLSLFVTVCYNIHFVINYVILIKKSFQYSYLQFLKSLWKEFVIGIALIAGVVLYPISIDHIVMSAVVKGMYMLLWYGVFIGITGEWKIFQMLLKKR